MTEEVKATRKPRAAKEVVVLEPSTPRNRGTVNVSLAVVPPVHVRLRVICHALGSKPSVFARDVVEEAIEAAERKLGPRKLKASREILGLGN